MSQMIDGARDDYDALDPLESDRPAIGDDRRARRDRRAVIVDESYGDDAFGDDAFSDVEPNFAADDDAYFDDDERAPHTPPRRSYEEPAAQTAPPARARRSQSASTAERRSGAVWWWAFLAALIWIGAVLGFSAGLLRLPTQPPSQLVEAALGLDPRIHLIVLAALAAPLGLIVQTAIAARRSQRVAVETRRLSRLVEELGGGGLGAGGGGGDGLRADAAEATRAFGALEAGFEAAEERMQLARSRFETERASLAKLVEDLDSEVARMTDTLTSLSGAATGATRAHATEFAELVAAAMNGARGSSTGGSGRSPDAPSMTPTMAPALSARSELSTSYAEPAASEMGLSGGESPREVVQRMADAAKQSLGADDDYSSSDVGDPATRQISALSRRLRNGLDDLDDDDDEVDPLADDLDADDGGYANAEPEPYTNGSYDEPDLGDPMGDPLDDPTSEPGFDDASGGADEGLDWSKLVRAANFPDSEDDRETLDALYAVLTDREAAALLQSAEDALSSLADFGLFMEDMQPRHAPVELWRAFIMDDARDGVMDLGGIRDPHAIEDVASALHEKPEFEETAKNFLERYESVLARLFREAPAPRMAVELADTRSGRAYMLIGRAFGRFG